MTLTHRFGRARDLYRVHRLEYPFPIAYVCHALWGACFAAPYQLLSAPVLLAVIANLIPLVAQNVLNAAADITVDARTPGKSDIARAAVRLGRGPLIAVASCEMAAALVLAIGVAVRLGRPLVAAAVAAGIVVEYLYNLEPVRLKKRGLANPVSLGMHFSFLPCLSTFNATRPDFPGFIWPLSVGLWLLLVGRTLWWSLPDADADRAAGLAPPAVHYGFFRAILLAGAATAAALALIAWGLAWFLGIPAALLGTTGCSFLLISKVRLARTVFPALHETWMRRHTLTFVVGADALLAALPLVKMALG